MAITARESDAISELYCPKFSIPSSDLSFSLLSKNPETVPLSCASTILDTTRE